MNRRMFSKFTSIIQHAVDAIAPPLSPEEEFIHHWKAVTTYFIESKGEKIPVEHTDIPAHMEQMLVILQEEEMSAEQGLYGPCLDYLLRHRILDTLYSLGRTDCPLGMKQMVLSFFTKLLSRVKQPLLRHANAHKAVQRLIRVCGEVRAGPAEQEEIQFLCTVCAKVKMDPNLVSFFLESVRPSHSNNGVPVTVEPTSDDKLQQEFTLVSALINLSHSEDSRVAVKACEGLILCASLPEPIPAHCLINTTGFCGDLTQRLVDTYRRLPEQINPADLEHMQAKWGMDIITEREDQLTFVGKRHLVSFLSWLDYCDQLCELANPIVAEALARTIHQQFLVPRVLPALLQVSEQGAISTTAYLTRCLRTVSSERLLSEFVYFMLGEERSPEVPGMKPDALRNQLIQRCNHVSDEVCLVTLQLFDTLLQKNDEQILHNLVLRNLTHRGYYDNITGNTSSLALCDNDLNISRIPDTSTPSKSLDPPVPNNQNDSGLEMLGTSDSPSETESSTADSNSVLSGVDNSRSAVLRDCDESRTSSLADSSGNCDHREMSSILQDLENVIERVKGPSEGQTMDEKVQEMNKSNSEDLKNMSLNSTGGFSSIALTPDSTPIHSRSHSRTEVHKVVSSFLSLLPEELKSSKQTSDSGYDMYLRDAHVMYTEVVDKCKDWDYPRYVENIIPWTETFYEGDFLHMVLDKLSHILDQSYAVNLQLTSLVSRLALVPHPNLHEFLLDPHLPLKPGVRNLYLVFQKVANEIRSQLAADPAISKQLLLVRRRLMGGANNMQSVRHSMGRHLFGFEGQGQLEAIIVLEEFCKELSAIAFVKHHAMVTEDT